MDASINGTPMQSETQEFLHFIASLVRLSKGMKIDLTVAEIGVDGDEFRREHKRKLELMRMLSRRSGRNDGSVRR